MNGFWGKLVKSLWNVLKSPAVREVVLGWVADELARKAREASQGSSNPPAPPAPPAVM